MSNGIVVGISTKNNEATIGKFVKKIDASLKKHFPKEEALIFCVDSFSTDKTKQEFLKTETKIEKKFLTEKGKRGKGSALKMVIEKAKLQNAGSLVFLDGDMKSYNEDWLKKLITPVLKEEADVVIPNYTRHKNDNLINDHIVYPMAKAFFGDSFREMTGNDFCLSKSAYMKFIGSTYYPHDASVGVFVTTTALCEGMNIIETKLGPKDHTQDFSQPELSIMPQFNQIMKKYIQLLRYYRTIITKNTVSKIKKTGKHDTKKPGKISFDLEAYHELSRNFLENENDYVSAVYENLNKQSVMGMKIAWINWLSLYLQNAKSKANAEKEIQKLIKVFAKKKDSVKL